MIGNNEQAIDKNLPSSNKEGVNEGNSKENQKISEAMNVMKIAMTPTTPKAMDFNGNGSSTRPPHRRALTAPGYLETEAEKPKESRTPSPNHSTLRRTTPERSNNNRPTSMPGTPYVRPRTITALSSVTEFDVNQLPCRLRNQRPASFHEIRDRAVTSLHATRPQRPRSLCDPSALPKEGSTDLRRMVLSTPATPISPLVSPTSPEDGAVSPVYSEPGGPNILRRKKTLKERLSWPGLWKKSTPEPKNLPWSKKTGAGGAGAGGASSGTLSPQVTKRMVGAGQEASSHSSSGTSGSSSSSKLRHAATCEANLSISSAQQLDAAHTMEDPETFDSNVTMASNGGSSSDIGGDDFDSVDGNAGTDPSRTKAALDHISKKITVTMDQIRDEQNLKEENVNEYLRLSANADRQQQQRIKTVFEKRNQKSTQSIAQLQRKLEAYQKRHRDVEQYGVSGHKQAKEVLRDVGHGLKGVVDNIRGAKETIVSKPKEFAHLIKNRFGSADNIANLKYDESQTGEESDVNIRHTGSGTLPANSYKFPSDDDASSVTSGSGPSAGAHSSPHPTLPHGAAPPTSSSSVMNQLFATRESSTAPTPTTDLEAYLTELILVKEMNVKLQETIETMRSQMLDDCRQLKQAIEEERYRSERLEEQINDQTELHQHEVTNIKQELSSMEEKMEYQLEERTRDMQELLDTCRTSITKMELQQQQQQLISMEGIENSNFRALLTKMINVVLAILAVVLVFVSTVANLLGPFLTTRVRILSTIALIAAIVLAWQNWHLAEDFGQYLIQKYRRFVPAQ